MRLDMPVIRLAALALLLLPTGAFAAEGMPQLDFVNKLTLAQVVWGAIIFVVLYLLLSRWALPQVAAVLATREATIRGDLDTAHAAKAKADVAIIELTDAIQRARTEAQASIASAVDQAKHAASAQAVVSNAKLEAQISAAEQSIGTARAAAMSALREVATDTANTIINRLTGLIPDGGRVDNAVGAVLTARGQN